MNSISALVYRNFRVAVDRVALIFLVLWPVLFIYVGGYSYSSLIGEKGVAVGNITITYPAYLIAGLICYNAASSSSLSGNIIWYDRRNGMLHQLLVMPFTRMQYIAGNIVTIVLIGMIGAAFITAVGLPVISKETNVTLTGLLYVLSSLITGSIFFGAITVIVAALLKSNETVNTIINGVFIFFGFASSAFYPASGVPEPLHTAVYLNPLSYMADITRAGLFSQIDNFTSIEVILMSILALVAFMVSVLLVRRLKV